VKAYYLDLLAYRSVSNAVAQHYGIEHQSPQVLLIKEGKCVYSETHMAIQPQLLSTV
jgi:bacillithiol system protein YtxJ